MSDYLTGLDNYSLFPFDVNFVNLGVNYETSRKGLETSFLEIITKGNILESYPVKIQLKNKELIKIFYDFVFSNIAKSFWFIDVKEMFKYKGSSPLGSNQVEVNQELEILGNERIYIKQGNDKLTFKVTSQEIINDRYFLNFADNLDRELTEENVAEIRFLKLVRFKTDNFPFNYKNINFAIVNFELLEVFDELL